MREAILVTKNLVEGKLAAKWEGSYVVKSRPRPGMYHLRAWKAVIFLTHGMLNILGCIFNKM